MAKEFVHPNLDEEFESISGRYAFTREETILAGGREVLYLVGYAQIDSSCCGTSGLGYALVPGLLVKKHARKTKEGNLISLVEPVTDASLKKLIEESIKDREQVNQVNFLAP